MRYLALAVDYDGTLATDGVVAPATIQALERLCKSGRKLIMVTGRELDDLFSCFGHAWLFDWIVAENGAVLYRPSDQAERVLASSPPPQLVAALRRRGIAPLSVGRVILATRKPHETAALEAIRDSGLEYQVIFNKDAVMLLPAGVNKASGLAAALKELSLSRHNVVGVGDAENDHAFLSICECSVAVANAIPALRSRVDWTTLADHGAGVVELIDRLLDDDLASFEPRQERHR